jgi:hypothetical protein
MIKLVVSVLILIVTELSILDNGKKISSGEEENKYGMMAKFMKESTRKALRMV